MRLNIWWDFVCVRTMKEVFEWVYLIIIWVVTSLQESARRWAYILEGV